MAATAPAAGTKTAVRNPYSRLPNWLYPTFVVVVLSLFGVYTVWVVLFQPVAQFSPYLSPFESPLITLGRVPPGIFVVWAPLIFRATCYYYRKAYFRSFFWHPRSCAVPDPRRGEYHGETRFPWVLNNLHRFTFYVIVVQVLFLIFDAILAFDFGGRFGIGLGTLLIAINLVLLAGYTFGCHALRHLAGGELDCFSCSRTARARFQLWRGITVLNIKHDSWAWASLFSVWFTDVYIRVLMHGWILDLRWIS
ncbi:MAG TPA: succinate dehydrogenase [Candidatus Dormibacteraeota bacterium]|nr:succinate dehydrogenase [Candidatus Dormibacteraeota bacterium]